MLINTFYVDGYTARNFAMFLYPLYALFIYRHYRSWDVTPWIAGLLLIFILFHCPWEKPYQRALSLSKVVKIYQRDKQVEKNTVYIYKYIKPQAYAIEHHNPGKPDHAVNMVFRIFIWEDMIKELIDNKAWFGMGLSHPLRSRQLEMLHWGEGEWGRDGWISAHNSYLYVIYRTGIIGLAAIGWLLFALYKDYRRFLRSRDLVGVLLVACVSWWLARAFTIGIFELPYNAIPMWCVIGLIFNRCKYEAPKFL